MRGKKSGTKPKAKTAKGKGKGAKKQSEKPLGKYAGQGQSPGRKVAPKGT